MDDVARLAGVAKATVCRALQDRPNVAPATRAKVLQAAKQIGYRADPSLSALSRRRWANSGQRSFRHVALIHLRNKAATRPKPSNGKPQVNHSPRAVLFPAIRRKLDQMGYQMSEYSCFDYKEGSQLSRVLYNRGVDGLILSVEGPVRNWGIAWDRFSALSVGHGSSELPHVTSDWMQAVTLAVEKAEQRGYRRIGFINLVHENPSLDLRVSSAIEHQRQRLEIRYGNRIPILSGQSKDFQPWQQWVPVVQDWFERWQPDVVIDGTQCAYHWLKTLGLEPPSACGYISIMRNFEEAVKHTTSVDHHYEVQGEWAVDLLSTMIQSNVKGIQEHPPRLTIPCGWKEGETLPALA